MRIIVSLVPVLLTAAASGSAAGPIEFEVQEIQRDFGVGYAVLVEDVNGDRKPDILAINPTQAVWYENPGWQKQVILDGATRKDNVCFAAYDVDRDGHLDLAIGADWQPRNTDSGGSLQWITRQGASGVQWRMTPIGEEPTLHRIRWADVDGDGRKELIVVPLHGRQTKPPDWNGQGARILVYRIPKDPTRDAWQPEVADDSMHIVHNFLVADLDGDRREEILTASREGVHKLMRGRNGKWSKTKIGEGSPGEIKLGRVGGKRHLATVEPWHANGIVIYTEAESGFWPRRVVEEQLTGGHALGWADFDGDGDDELAAGWRDKKGGVAVYKHQSDGTWTRQMVDDGGMAAEDLAVADLDGDKRPEIVAAGRATGNVRIYWNRTKR